MTGFPDLPFRKIFKRYLAGLTVIAILSLQHMIRETRQTMHYPTWAPSAGAGIPVGARRAPRAPSQAWNASRQG